MSWRLADGSRGGDVVIVPHVENVSVVAELTLYVLMKYSDSLTLPLTHSTSLVNSSRSRPTRRTISSGFVWAHHINDIEAETVKAVLDEYSDVYSGPPNRITLDGGTKLTGSLIQEWFEKNGVTYDISAVES